MPVRLTEALLDSLTPSDRDQYLFDTVITAFGFRLTPAGKGIYFVGKGPRHTVGYRPPIKLSPARELAAEMLVDIRLGRNPKLANKARTQAVAAGVMTVAPFADRWLADHVRPKLKPRTFGLREAGGAAHQASPWPSAGDTVDRDDVVQLHLAMKRTPRRANYTVSTFHAIFNFAEDLGLRPRGNNPAKRIKRYREGKIESFLTETEMAKAAEGIGPPSGQGRSGRMPPPACAWRCSPAPDRARSRRRNGRTSIGNAS